VNQVLDWSSIEHFMLSEFPSGVVEKMEPSFIHRLDLFRAKLGRKVFPSPLVGGWIRTDGSETSRHYIGADGNQRLSDAVDVFPDCDLFYAMTVAIQCGFTGIGLYFDTQRNGKPWSMLHLDTRPGPLTIWTRKYGEYETIHPRPDGDFFKQVSSK